MVIELTPLFTELTIFDALLTVPVGGFVYVCGAPNRALNHPLSINNENNP
jgi:hypothetical protein